MTKKEFNDFLAKKVMILDGATGTELQKRGMPGGVCPEQWVIENPQVIIEVQRNYIEAGSDAVYACSFGANRLKLEEFGLEDKVYEMNKSLAGISRQAVGKDKFVIGDLAPTGRFVEPFGDLPFDEAVEVFKEQAKGLVDGGVDFFVIETMIDIQEIRAALIAVKEVCDLPVLCSMTYSAEGLTLTGTDPVTALITLQSLGAAAVGCNCSTGPVEMLKVVKQIKPHATVPIIIKPNAGLPKLVDGKTVFDMKPEEFASYANDFVEAGANLYGGCCGTAPAYIQAVAEKTASLTPIMPLIDSISAVSSARKSLFLPKDGPVKIIGERINPTGKKKFQEKLREGKLDDVKRFASEQENSGADLLDVNMGMGGINEEEMLLKSIKLLSSGSTLPLVIDSSNPEVIEKALRLYPGRALINSISAESHKMERLLKAAAWYGAMFIALPLTENEIPPTCEGRIKVVETIYEKAREYGLTKDHMVIDGLVMTVSSDQNAAKETLAFFNWCRNDFGVNTVCGLSNISFGLPGRKWVNSAFMAMAVNNGLTMAIANPNEELLMNLKMASDVLMANDKGSKLYIKEFAGKKDIIIKKEGSGSAREDKKAEKKEKTLFDNVVEGDEDIIDEMVQKALDSGKKAQELVNDLLIPGINKVGELYDQKKYFLPQLIASADTMKRAFNYLEPYLEETEEGKKEKVKIIMATVKGDIHDIGKNIVTLMLKNYGFDVLDLGKDVPAETIISVAEKEKINLIGLSALMTTTMTEMKTVIDLAKEKGLDDLKFILGGAVITEEYTKEIGAHGFAKDSIEAVKIARSLSVK